MSLPAERICTRLSLADEAVKLGVSLGPLQRSRLQSAMANAAVALRKLRTRRLKRQWALLHKDVISAYGVRYYRKNYDAIAERRSTPEAKAKKAEWSRRYQATHEYRSRRASKYRANPEPVRARTRAFNKSERGRKYAREYQRRRRRENPQIHFINWIRGAINRSLRRSSARKHARCESLIGLSFADLRSYLEARFENAFSWSNRSAWDVDHYVPVSAFDLTDAEEQRWAFYYKNMRPMDRMKNKHKSAIIPSPLPDWLPAHIAARINSRR